MSFEGWIDNPAQAVAEGKLCTAQEYHALTARKKGFSSGDVISSKEVNSALRQANLVTSALCQAVGMPPELTIESVIGQLTQRFKAYFNLAVEAVIYNDRTRKLGVRYKSGITYTYDLGDFPTQVDSAEKDGNGNVITETYATKVELADYATVGQLSDYVTQSVANATYATKEELDNYLTEANAELIYATKTELNEQASWSEEYDSINPTKLLIETGTWYETNRNIITVPYHTAKEDDNFIVSIADSATKQQCEAFNASLLVLDRIESFDDDFDIYIKALGDIPSIDIPVKVVKI